MATRTPPMIKAPPVVGSLLEWRRDHDQLFLRAYRELGPVFGVRLGPRRGAVLIGPQHHEFYFREVDRRLSVPELYRFVVPMFGDVMMAATDTARRRRHVALLQSAFQSGRLAGYADVMTAEVDAWLDSLGESGEFDLWDAVEPVVMRIAASALMGAEIRARIDEFRPLLVDLARGMEFILPPNLPLRRFRRRDQARRELAEMVRPMLAERRRAPGRHDDFLQVLADDAALAAEGDEVPVGMALCTIFTGYITTAAQACWTLALLLRHPTYLARVVDAADRTSRAALLDLAFKEALRLRPVMGFYARTNRQDLHVGGYRLPRGWMTMLCPGVAHRLPEIFADPDRYDPDRFAPSRAEDKRHPHALIGFSGGFYRCPGQAFGTTEVRVLLNGLISRYDLEPLAAEPAADLELGVTRPRSPCPVRYRRRQRWPGAAAVAAQERNR
ncbi:cytochrome P450 [Mangrovihabitans endophyticus]|uniref:Cytochrome P450 n=1 Tax=Mangrovihabitans endophyticus TaxID=1751298 RepID=A0A8J3BXH5_9ACTN|nr:cytochrome P450 [Mangrovihabitans endophyticus]GGK76565.1 cytochrome P450 [Mangrovihabitans endophyticus]